MHGSRGRSPSHSLLQAAKASGQRLLNIYLFANFAGWSGWQVWRAWQEQRLGFVEGSFFVQGMVVAFLFLIRLPHREVDTNPWHQAVALVAFLSGAAFMGQPASGDDWARGVSTLLVLSANLLAIITLTGLGRSFGIFIALRKVRSHGAYGIVRHPMYATDILLRLGFLVGHANPFTLLVFAASTVCYVYRALLEEQFLARQAEYRAYMAQVRYRFIPGLL